MDELIPTASDFPSLKFYYLPVSKENEIYVNGSYWGELVDLEKLIYEYRDFISECRSKLGE